MKKIEVVLDFDGTIVDIYERYYRIFKEFYKIDISKEQYIKLKKIYPNDKDLIKFLELDIESFERYKKIKAEKLENEEYLKLDTLIISKKQLFEILQNREYIVLTIRKEKSRLYKQLKWLNLEEIEDRTIVLSPKNKFIKREYILENREKFSKYLTCIGDSETDLEIGKIKNVKIYHVNSGLRDSENLKKEYNFISLKSIKEIRL